jgi:hypothetical protein
MAASEDVKIMEDSGDGLQGLNHSFVWQPDVLSVNWLFSPSVHQNRRASLFLNPRGALGGEFPQYPKLGE